MHLIKKITILLALVGVLPKWGVTEEQRTVPFPFCFDWYAKRVPAATIPFGGNFQVIPKGGTDNQVKSYSRQPIYVGETLTTKGGQSQDYAEILEIDSYSVKVRHYGFAKGFGNYNNDIKLPILNKCITKN